MRRPSVVDCAPASVFRRSSRDASPAASLHHAHTRLLLWRGSKLDTVRILTSALAGWPAYFAATMMHATWLNGAAIRARTGISIIRQLRQQLELGFIHGLPPRWYYTFELFESDHRRRAWEYLQRGETKRGVYGVLKRAIGAPLSPLTDKVAFAERCRTHDLPAVPVLLTIIPGAFASQRLDRTLLPRLDLFAKPNRGKGGRGAERWDYVDGDVYRNAGGIRLRAAELVQRFRKSPIGDEVLIQPRRVNHRDLRDLANDALATVRIVTCRNERGTIEATNAVLRMAQGRNHVVDNFHAGGLAARVDLASGTLGAATDLGVRPTTGWRTTHPDSGASIAGRKVPLWPETLALAVRAHAAFADRVVVGWDIGILDQGPELVEGNGAPDLDIVQRTHREPIGNARLGELLAYHLNRLVAVDAEATCSFPPGSPLPESAPQRAASGRR